MKIPGEFNLLILRNSLISFHVYFLEYFVDKATQTDFLKKSNAQPNKSQENQTDNTVNDYAPVSFQIFVPTLILYWSL